jgi:hypothetical protein
VAHTCNPSYPISKKKKKLHKKGLGGVAQDEGLVQAPVLQKKKERHTDILPALDMFLDILIYD